MYIDADLRDPGTILSRAGQTLDFSQPVAVMLIAVLHLIPDEDDPRASWRRSWTRCPPGATWWSPTRPATWRVTGPNGPPAATTST